MRSSKSRSRSKGNRNRNTMGNVVNRVFDSSGPDGKVRGTPQQIIEKYNQLARDAQLANDRVAAENFQQHAEHYQRLLSEAHREQDQKREQQERENRERQAQRDRERNEREGDDRGTQETDQTQGASGKDAGDPGSGPQPDMAERGPDNDGGKGGGNSRRRRGKSADDGNGGSGSDVVDLSEESNDSHLVDTPENAEKPKPKRKPRKKPAPAAAEGDAPAPAEDTANNG